MRKAAAAFCLAPLLAGTSAAGEAADPTPGNVKRLGTDLYELTAPALVARTEKCAVSAPSAQATLQRQADGSWLRFAEPPGLCRVIDLYAPVLIERGEYRVVLTRAEAAGWYQVDDRELYLNTVGCVIAAGSATAFLSLDRDGGGRLRFPGGLGCRVVRVYRHLLR